MSTALKMFHFQGVPAMLPRLNLAKSNCFFRVALVFTALFTLLELNPLFAQTDESVTMGPRPTVYRPPQPTRQSFGFAFTWDGLINIRLFVRPTSLPPDPTAAHVYMVRVLRPQLITMATTTDGKQFPNLDDPKIVSPISAGSVIQPVISSRYYSREYGADKNYWGALGLALVPDPRFPENPYRSRDNGVPDMNGAFETYQIFVYTRVIEAKSGDSLGLRIGRYQLKVVVENPHTPTATIFSATAGPVFEGIRDTSGQFLIGIEPTLTADGRLMIFQSASSGAGDGTLLLFYSYNANPLAVTGWSRPRPLSDLHNADRDTPLAGLTMSQRYPLARQPLIANDGQVFSPGEQFRGAYPWIDQEGSDLVYAATSGGIPGVNLSLRGGVSIIGRLTNYRLRHIDGAINPDRDGRHSTRPSLRTLNGSLGGLIPSMWSKFAGPGKSLPYLTSRWSYPLLNASSASYEEVAMDDVIDASNVLVLHFNETAIKNKELHIARTPDSSAFGGTAFLEDNLGNTNTEQAAKFPVEYNRSIFGTAFDFDDHDVNPGVLGRAVYFPHAGRVRVPKATQTSNLTRFTLSFFVKPLFSQLSQTVFNKPGVLSVSLSAGRPRIIMRFTDSTRVDFSAPAPLPTADWSHLAISFSNRVFSFYINGVLVEQQTFATPKVPVLDSQDTIIGPSAQLAAHPGVTRKTAILMVDELYLSNAVKTQSEIERLGYRFQEKPCAPLPPGADLPLGLNASELRLPPESPLLAERVALGKLLFFDKRLSSNGLVSCASCHMPGRSFADNLIKARALDGTSLPRNTPTIFNRAFSDLQFFDGRAPDLEAQALAPFANPLEMNSSVKAVIAKLQSLKGYVAMFNRVYGAPETNLIFPALIPIRPETVANALATFERTVFSGNSRVDQFEAGLISDDQLRVGRALFNGKARCVSCHSGSNYSDERFHNTGFFVETAAQPIDRGRVKITGQAQDYGAFKTPTLRDIKFTAPYMHNGSIWNLARVVELYNQGGLPSARKDFDMKPLGLTPSEVQSLVYFLENLTGTQPDIIPPLQFPQ